MEKCPIGLKYAFSGCKEIHLCVLQDIGPLGPLPCSHSTSLANHSKQGIGYRWPCAILGWLCLNCTLFNSWSLARAKMLNSRLISALLFCLYGQLVRAIPLLQSLKSFRRFWKIDRESQRQWLKVTTKKWLSVCFLSLTSSFCQWLWSSSDT